MTIETYIGIGGVVGFITAVYAFWKLDDDPVADGPITLWMVTTLTVLAIIAWPLAVMVGGAYITMKTLKQHVRNNDD